jgi:cytochrome c-type biogenesis protein CcmH/NrfF
MRLGSDKFRAGLSLLTAAALLMAANAPALAAAHCPRTTELAMETRVMCQVCGVPLALANSLEADRERAFITALVNRCESVAQIESGMVAQYGPGILATPGTHGFAITAWLVPGVGVLAAALAIAAVLALGCGRRRRAPLGAPPAEPLTASEEARLDAALAAYDGRCAR